MANTYTQFFYHLVFAVKGRENLIHISWKDDLYKYISGIIEKQGQKLYILNGMPDHIHLLISCKPTVKFSDLVKEVKEHSTKYINQNKLVKGKFSWQEGYGAFTVSFGNVNAVLNYIKNQEEHHNKKTFREEYIGFLEEQQIVYNEKFIFEENLV
ncbi:MAG: IS200/IS605 family transposase [Bacteroidia bacterium]